MMLEPRPLGRFSLLLIFLLALGFRLGYQHMAVVTVPIRGDAAQYLHIALNLLHEGVFSLSPPGSAAVVPDDYRSPGYPLFLLAVIGSVGESPIWYALVLTLQALMGALTACLTALLASRCMPRPAALATGLLMAVWPHLVTLSGYVLTETLLGFVLTAALYAFCKCRPHARTVPLAGAGLLFSFATLINPVMTLLPLMLLPWLWKDRRSTLVFLLASLALPLLWMVRGHSIEPAPNDSARSRLMENVFIGMQPDFDLWYQDDPAGIAAKQAVSDQLAAFHADPGSAPAAIAGELASRPGHYARWYLLGKPLKIWNWRIGQGAGDIYVYPTPTSPFEAQPAYRLIASLCHGLNPLLAAGALGGLLCCSALLLRKRKPPLELISTATLAAYAIGFYTLLAPDARYGVPFRGAEFLLAAFFFSWLWQRLQSLRSQTAGRRVSI